MTLNNIGAIIKIMENIEEKWERALKETEIIRSRAHLLSSIGATELPYIFLCESSLNMGDTVVRNGKVMVEKPSLILISNHPQFEGFEFETDYKLNKDTIVNFLLVRGVTFPSFKYTHQTCSIDIYEGQLKKAIEHFNDALQRAEDVHSGLIVGPEDCWQFSVLIFVCSMVTRSASNDIKRLLDDFRKRKGLN